MVGAGGMAGHWVRHFLPDFRNRMEIVALVDVRPDPLKASGDFLELSESRRFNTAAEAFEKVEADFCIIVVPPAFHAEGVQLASARKMDILSEKPIADTWAATVEIARMARLAGVRMQVVQNYRYTPRVAAFRKAIQDGRIGRLNYLVSRFAADYRQRNAWGAFRHEIPHTLLIEGAIHHLDQLRNLAGADCRSISGYEWRPEQESFDGEPCGLFTMAFTNETHGVYEGNCLEAGTQNSWYEEFYRAEGDDGALILDRDHVVRLIRNHPGQAPHTEEIPLEPLPYEGHKAIIDQFLLWLEGGPTPPTAIEDNIKSAAMLFGAIQASENNQVVDVQALVQEAQN